MRANTITPLLCSCIVALSQATPAIATQGLDGQLRHHARALGGLHRRIATLARRASGDGSPNTTLAETARMSLLVSQRASWEQGTAQAALTEYDAGEWSVFAGRGAPYRSGQKEDMDSYGKPPMAVLSMAYHSVGAQDSAGKLCSSISGDENVTAGSAADSASCGESVLMGAFVDGQVNATSGFWIGAARRELRYLLQRTPRLPSGAISHRASQQALWSDAVYMMPPYLAAFGLYTSNQTLLQMAYDQCRLYRDGLRLPDGPGQGLWGHIAEVESGSEELRFSDASAWATGEGWAAAGMLRTLAAISQSSYSQQMADQKNDLVSWTREILDAAYPFLDPSRSLFHNYINDSSTFLDTAGSTFIAYATFRLASMSEGDSEHIDAAEQIYQSVQDELNPMGQFQTPVVNALSFGIEGTTSPESLSFTLLLEAARRDYHKGNVTSVEGPSANGAGACIYTSALSSTLAFTSLTALLMLMM